MKNNQKKKNTERRYTSKQKIFKIHFKDSLAARFTVRMSVLASTSAKLKLGAELGGEGEGCFAGMRGGWHEWLHKLSLCWFPDLGPGSRFSRSLIFEIQA